MDPWIEQTPTLSCVGVTGGWWHRLCVFPSDRNLICQALSEKKTLLNHVFWKWKFKSKVFPQLIRWTSPSVPESVTAATSSPRTPSCPQAPPPSAQAPTPAYANPQIYKSAHITAIIIFLRKASPSPEMTETFICLCSLSVTNCQVRDKWYLPCSCCWESLYIHTLFSCLLSE